MPGLCRLVLGAAPASLSRGPRRACLPAPPRRRRPRPRPRPARATARVPVPCLGPSRPRLASRGCRPPASAGPVASPGGAVPSEALSEGGGAGSPARVRAVGAGAAGVRRESVLPGPAAALGVAVAVGASPARVGAPVRRRPGWCRGTAPVPGGPLAVRSRGGPRRPTRVPSAGSLWAVPLAVARGHPTSATGCVVSAPRGRTPSVPLSVRPSASVPSPSAAPRGRVPRCASLPGPAAAPIRRPCRRRRRRRRRRVLDEGAPPPRCARPSAGRVPGLAPPRGPVAVSSPPGLPRPALGWVDGWTPRARVGRPRRGGPGRAGWRREKGGWPAALLLPPHHPGPPPRASRAVAAARRDPRGPEGASRGRASSPRAGPGRSGLPARRAPFPTPPPPASGLPHLTGGGGSPSRLAPLPPAPTGTPGSSSSCSLPPTWLILPVAYACLKD